MWKGGFGKYNDMYGIDFLPVRDGMVAAGGKLLLTTMDGKAICLSD